MHLYLYICNPEPAEFLKWINPRPSFELSIIILRDIKSWSVNCVEYGQTARMCRLAWLYLVAKTIQIRQVSSSYI